MRSAPARAAALLAVALLATGGCAGPNDDDASVNRELAYALAELHLADARAETLALDSLAADSLRRAALAPLGIAPESVERQAELLASDLPRVEALYDAVVDTLQHERRSPSPPTP